MNTLKNTTSLLLLCMIFACHRPGPEPPNILLIVADDLGWKDAGFMGSTYYETPNLDKLASQGIVFNQAYAAASNCAPSRACLMTGMYPTKHGIYTVGSAERGATRTRRIIPVSNLEVLSEDFYTLSEALKDAGYITCNIGKWHLGEDPLSQGMDMNVGGGMWGHPGSYFAPYIVPNLEAPEGEYLTDRLTGESLKFIRDHRDQPFFLYLSYYAVHTPIQPKTELQDKYLGKGAGGCQNNAAYAAMVDNLDRCIGLLAKELSALNLDRNTLVIFTSDNGGVRQISCQDPLRAGKGSYYEGGIRVPLVMKWPEIIDSGSFTDVPVINMDFYPTIADICRIGTEGINLDGVSLLPLIKGGSKIADRALYFHFPVYLQAYSAGYDGGRDPLFRTRPGSVIRKGAWKLHYYYEDGETELYNLFSDPGETNDLSDINTYKAKELQLLLESWLENEHAPVKFDQNPLFDPLFQDSLMKVIHTRNLVGNPAQDE